MSVPNNQTAVVCHDAGGANQILAMISAGDIQADFAYMEGPALTIAQRVISPTRFTNCMEEALTKSSTVITGTGWASRIEHDARSMAREYGSYSIAVLDHWVNYPQRFVRDERLVLPDEIWVVDEYAFSIAQTAFEHLKISIRPDRYAWQELNRIAPISNSTMNELLYLLEPIRSTWGRNEAGEIQALRYFLERLHLLNLPSDIKVRFRLHPSEPAGKYDEVLSQMKLKAIEFDEGNLHESISRARWVAGCQTYALTLALKANRTAYVTLPPWAPNCPLPHRGLVHIKDL